MTRKITHLATGQGQYDGHVVHRLYVAYDDNTLWLRDEEGRWNELDQPPFTAPPEGVADQNERVGRVGLGWYEDGCWQCLCGGEADHKPPIADHCWRCHALRPPRPAGEDAR